MNWKANYYPEENINLWQLTDNVQSALTFSDEITIYLLSKSPANSVTVNNFNLKNIKHIINNMDVFMKNILLRISPHNALFLTPAAKKRYF